MTRAAAEDSIGIVGAGVSGVTTALLLQLEGAATVLYALQRPTGSPRQAWAAPEFATLHAAASVLPHSVRATRMGEWTTVSRAFFRALAFLANTGVRTQTHYEVFERAATDLPAYAAAVDNLEPLASDARLLRRLGSPEVSGWSFDAYFCESPAYLRWLFDVYRGLGGRVVTGKEMGSRTHLADYLDSGHRVLVNCTGLGSRDFLDERHLDGVEDAPDGDRFEPLVDAWPARVVRGHYLRAAIDAPLVDARGRFVSYNYTPLPEVYPAAGGVAGDVYCYPRADAWLLGGSRQAMDTSGSGDGWEGASECEWSSFDRADGERIGIPRPIFDLNAELVLELSGGAISLARLRDRRPGVFSAGVGYRFERDHPTESVRVERSRVRRGAAEAIVVHNYGHGGAGFTLSWGCASEVGRLIRDVLPYGGEAAGSRASVALRPAVRALGSVLARLDGGP